MTKEEFLKRVKEDKEWAPGWETIEHEFERLYPGAQALWHKHDGQGHIWRRLLPGRLFHL